MSLQQKIISAQLRILDKLIEWEGLIGRLYNRYGERFPEQRALWHAMAGEEEGHAEALAELRALVEQGHLLEGIGEFNGERVDAEIAHVKQALERSDRNNLRPQDAVAIAREIETSVIESQFYDVVTCRADGVDTILTRLRDETHDHIERLRRLRG